MSDNKGFIADGGANVILSGDNLALLKKIPSQSVELIYIDPPFNTGKIQARKRIRATAAADGNRIGFGGRRYHAQIVSGDDVDGSGYVDKFVDYIKFLRPRLRQAHRILTADGSLFFHIDWRESARCRLLLEGIFGGARHCINEIIWAYDFGARSRRRWSPKHDNIYWFAKDATNYIYNYDAIDRVPYMAPALAGAVKAARGKTPTDVWWQTIVATNSAEKTGYATQKPLRLLDRIVRAHSRAGGTVLDFFAGSGTTGVAAARAGRRYILIEQNPCAIKIIKKRLSSD